MKEDFSLGFRRTNTTSPKKTQSQGHMRRFTMFSEADESIKNVIAKFTNELNETNDVDTAVKNKIQFLTHANTNNQRISAQYLPYVVKEDGTFQRFFSLKKPSSKFNKGSGKKVKHSLFKDNDNIASQNVLTSRSFFINNTKTDTESILTSHPDAMANLTNLCSKLKKNLTMHQSDRDKKISSRVSQSPASEETQVVSFEEEEEEEKDEEEKKEDIQRSDSNATSDTAIREKKCRKLLSKYCKVYDSLSETEEDEESVYFFYYLPRSYKTLTNDALQFFASIYIFLFCPIDLAFCRERSKGAILILVCNVICDIVYIFDIYFSFFRAFRDKEDNLITSSKDIASHYFSSWFFLDLMVSFPFSFIDCSYHLKEKPINSNMVWLVKLLKIFKVYKLSSHNRFVKIISDYCHTLKLGRNLLMIVSLLFYFICMHVLSCVFIFIGRLNDPNWMIMNGIDENDIADTYVASIYFINSSILAIGYGDISCVNITERQYSVFLLTIGLLVYSWLLSTLSKFGNENDFKILDKVKAEEMKTKLRTLQDIRASNFIRADLFKKIERYIIHKYHQQTLNVHEIFGALPIFLKNELIFKMYQPIIDNFIFFKYYKNPNFIIKVLMNLEPVLLVKNDIIFSEEELVEEIVFVKKGKLAIELPLPQDIQQQVEEAKKLKNKIFKKKTIGLHKGITIINRHSSVSFRPRVLLKKEYVKLIDIRNNEHFGDVLMFLNQKSPLRVRVSSKKADLLLLRKLNAINISSSFPDIWKEIISSSLHNMNQINIIINKTLELFKQNNNQVIGILTETSEKIDKKNQTMNSLKKLVETRKIKEEIENLPNSVLQFINSEPKENINSVGSFDSLNVSKESSRALMKKNSKISVRKEKSESTVKTKEPISFTDDPFKSTKTFRTSMSLDKTEKMESACFEKIESEEEDNAFSQMLISQNYSINKEIKEGENFPFGDDKILKKRTKKTVSGGGFSNLTLESVESLKIERIIPLERVPKRKTKIKSQSTKEVTVFSKKFNLSNTLSRRSRLFSPKKKSSSSLLTQIELNIENHSLNLKNPDLFYKKKFDVLLEQSKSESILNNKLDDLLRLVENK